MATRDLTALQAINERALAKRIGLIEREMTAIYREARERVNTALARAYEKYAVNGALTNAEMTKYNRNIQLQRQLDKIINDANGAAITRMNRLSADQYEEAFFRSAWAFDQHTGVALQWGRINQAAIRAAIENPLDKIAQRRLRAMSRERIRSTVASGLIRGASYPDMAREMSGSINGTRYDSIRIARTEAGRAQVIGMQNNHDAAEALGIEGNEYWMATLDDRTRDSHQDLDGAQKDREHNGWWLADHRQWTPGPHQSGIASEDINCRCYVDYRVDDLPPDVRRARDEGIIPYQTYNEWRPRS